jgi:hypothetical protein
MVLALIFAELLGGGVLLVSAITGHSPSEVIKGEADKVLSLKETKPLKGEKKSAKPSGGSKSSPEPAPNPSVAPPPIQGSTGFSAKAGTNYTNGQLSVIAQRLDKLAKHLGIHLEGISGYRSPQHSVEVGGFSNDPHTRGEASDTEGIQNVPKSVLNLFGLERPFPEAKEKNHIQLLHSATSFGGY